MPYVFVDFEASGLAGSHPIEFAFVVEDGLGQATLIRPEPEWTLWDPTAEALHGISRERLLTEGIPAWDVARRALSVLTADPDIVAVSDAPEWDTAWLDLLLSVLPDHPRIAVRSHWVALKDAVDPLMDLVPDWLPSVGGNRAHAMQRVRNLGKEIVERAQEVERQRGPVTHRALPDAEALWRVWRAVREAVTEEMRLMRMP